MIINLLNRRYRASGSVIALALFALLFAVACAAPTPTPAVSPAAVPTKPAVPPTTVPAKPAATPAALATASPVPTKPAPTPAVKVASPVASPTVALRAATPAATPGDAQRLTVTLNAVGGSGVSGQAVLEPVGNQTRVTVTLRGLPPNTRHAGHTHTGTCAQQGPVETPLVTVAAGADGSGTSQATINMSLTQLRDGRHYVQFHIGETPPGAPVVCGDIPR